MTLKIGIAGLGTVGADVFRLIAEHKGMLRARTGQDIVVCAVSARNQNKDRGLDLSGIAWHDDPVDLASSRDVDVVVELMGGAKGAAFDLISTAIKSGKHVVTANKALLALHAGEVLETLKTTKRAGAFTYEAAVAGGIPIIKGLREGLAGNKVRAVYGILNGTCNYMLSEMTQTGRGFDEILKEAQDKGYAEADPTFDVDGIDAAHKTAILAGLAFGCAPDFESVKIKGIRGVSPLDIAFGKELGYRIKLLGIAQETDEGILQSVEPCLVPQDTPVAAVEGPLNAVYADGDYVGKVLLVGAGAGGRATASAVVADIADIACGQKRALMGVDAPTTLKAADIGQRMGTYFMRLTVLDLPGVIADVATILRNHDVSMETVLQRGRDPGQPVSVIITTHEAREAAIDSATAEIARLGSCSDAPHVMRIETF